MQLGCEWRVCDAAHRLDAPLLDDDCGRHDTGGTRVAELGGEQHEQRAEPFAAGLDQVA